MALGSSFHRYAPLSLLLVPRRKYNVVTDKRPTKISKIRKGTKWVKEIENTLMKNWLRAENVKHIFKLYFNFQILFFCLYTYEQTVALKEYKLFCHF